MHPANSILVAACALITIASNAAAQKATYTFEELPLNTAVTTQYYGVTFSVLPQTCGNSPTLYMRIRTPTGGTSSHTHALGIDTGCPDFSADYLRMVFDLPQTEVSFTVGDYAATYQVRTYEAASGGTPLSTQNIVAAGSGFVGVHRFVRVANTTPFRRIEVEAFTSGLFEWIDDLTFEIDRTPPVASFSSPAPLDCFCSGRGIFGSAYDPDGPFLNWRLDRAPVGTDTWTLINTSTTPLPSGLLSNWFPSSAADEGVYTLRLTATNAAGLSTTATTVVWLSRTFDTVDFVVPTIAGGTVCPDGTVFDNYCGTDTYTVEYAPVGSSRFAPVDPANPTYSGSRVNQQLASWNTRGIVDGNYQIRATGANVCAHTLTTTRPLTIDNTSPIALISSPANCQTIRPGTLRITGTATDANFGAWTLQYTGGDAHGWVTIASGVGPIVGGTLANWNTTGLRLCDYTIRLVATDTATVDCWGGSHNRGEYTVSIRLGCPADVDDGSGSGSPDGGVTIDDLLYFLERFAAGC